MHPPYRLRNAGIKPDDSVEDAYRKPYSSCDRFGMHGSILDYFYPAIIQFSTTAPFIFQLLVSNLLYFIKSENFNLFGIPNLRYSILLHLLFSGVLAISFLPAGSVYGVTCPNWRITCLWC